MPSGMVPTPPRFNAKIGRCLANRFKLLFECPRVLENIFVGVSAISSRSGNHCCRKSLSRFSDEIFGICVVRLSINYYYNIMAWVYRLPRCDMKFDMLLIPSTNLTQIFAARKYRKSYQNLKRERNVPY